MQIVHRDHSRACDYTHHCFLHQLSRVWLTQITRQYHFSAITVNRGCQSACFGFCCSRQYHATLHIVSTQMLWAFLQRLSVLPIPLTMGLNMVMNQPDHVRLVDLPGKGRSKGQSPKAGKGKKGSGRYQHKTSCPKSIDACCFPLLWLDQVLMYAWLVGVGFIGRDLKPGCRLLQMSLRLSAFAVLLRLALASTAWHATHL